MTRVYLHHLGIVNALGWDLASVRESLLAGSRAGMLQRDDLIKGRSVYAGTVSSELPALPAGLACYDSRNNRVLTAALAQIRPAVDAALARYGAARVGTIIGTSTSGIAEGERAILEQERQGRFPSDYDYRMQEISSPSEYLRQLLGLKGPCWTVSTACTSSAKAFSSARRLLSLDRCDAVIVGGADSLCRLTLNGFGALESLSKGPCNPSSKNRDGINIGEGAALFLMSREPGPIALLGIGESSDAYHISGPDPTGRGAEIALRQALTQAGVASVDYLNLHGTATVQNDLMENAVVARVLGQVPCSSTKPLVGHTLGAAGATEAAFCWMLLSGASNPALPPHLWDGVVDPALAPLNFCPVGYVPKSCKVAASNSFAFGGNNACLVLGN
ncbi:MAG TPA: beta-ketoacyl-[acyl-carrier-protein] synthase family protein [Gammaproteobacteria bacterium]|jgi:3-oxoacyl-[acyl-carrier-protein] synthase-1|nr:beta-ketoacyl-[acyl-carrier-protein] synthase family protein [Gammaproteobacteria bacterium]